MENKKPVNTKEKVSEVCTRAARVLERMEDTERMEMLVPAYKRVAMGIFRLVVMGEIKKGKSSFINALLSEPELLPTASDIATSTVFKIMYAPERKLKVFFQPDIDTGIRPDVLEISSDQVSEYGTEAGNPKNIKRVDFIGVELPNALLKSGLVIVDTPGVGGLFKEHRDITLRYAPNADAVLFVVDSVESVISRDEIEFLKELSRISSQRVAFVQTKIDATDDETWKTWQDRNQKVIAENIGIPVEKQLYFPVSANLKKIADRRKDGQRLDRSGYLNLLNYLNHKLIPNKESELARDAAKIFQGCLCEIMDVQKRAINVLQQNSREALAEMQKNLNAKRQSLVEWRSTVFQSETKSFNEMFQDLNRETRKKFQRELDPQGVLVSTTIENLRNSRLSAEDIEECLQTIQQDLMVIASECAANIQKMYNDKVINLVEESSEKLGSSLGFMNSDSNSDNSNFNLQASLNMQFSTFENIKTGMYGGMAGFGIANVAVFLTSILFPPVAVIGTVAAILSGCIGGKLATDNANARQKNEALRLLEQALQKLLRQICQTTIDNFDEQSIKLGRQVSDAFSKVAEQFQRDIEKEIRDVQEATNANKEELASKLKDNNEMLNETALIMKEVELLLKG